MDLGVSASALILLSPLFVVIAAAIFLADRKAVLYRQERAGLNGRRFTMIKFRTMRLDAECDQRPVWSIRKDPRCTPIGSFLRRFGLDELPQFWNILKGEMSLVGPRPERPEFIQQFSRQYPTYARRDAVHPGLTGFAQIHGWRGSTSIEERLRHDLYYIQHWSNALDLKIFLQTFVHGWSETTRNGVR